MASLKAVIYKAKALKDGKHKIRLSLCHKGVTLYIVTDIVIDKESEFSNGLVVGRSDARLLNARIHHLLAEYEQRLWEIPNIEVYSTAQLVKMITYTPAFDGCCTFQSVSKEYIEILHKQNRESYAKLMQTSERLFTQFSRGDIPMSGVTQRVVYNYKLYLMENGNRSDTYVNMLLSRLKVIVNYAIRQGKVNYDKHPFLEIKIGSAPIREDDISVKTLRKILSSSPTTKGKALARDMFSLSFYLGGMNLADIYKTDFSDEETLSYIRQKSVRTSTQRRKVVLTIPEEARNILSRWRGEDGKLDFGYNYTYENFRRYVTKNLGELTESLGIKEHVEFYSARKTFAQIATDLDISDSVIDYCLGHSGRSRGVIRYYSKIRQKHGDDAVCRVLEYVHNNCE